MRARQDSDESQRSFTREDANRASATVVHYAIVNTLFNTVKSISMNGTLILTSARKAVAVRLAALNRHFCQDDVEEMVSRTVERFLTKGAYDPSKSSVQTYVSRIAFNVVFDFVKAADKARGWRYPIDSRMESPLFAVDHGADYHLLVDERDRLVKTASDRLNPRQKAFFDLINDGHSNREIAVLMDTSAGNVAVEACRMKKRMRTLLNEAA